MKERNSKEADNFLKKIYNSVKNLKCFFTDFDFKNDL